MPIESPFDAETPIAVRLLLDDGGQRAVHTSAGLIAFGALQVRGWQIHRVLPRPENFSDRDAYLLKINYDLMLEPGAPGPSWFEVGFAMSDAVVVDAIPACVLEPQQPKSYVPDAFLVFMPGAGVSLPVTHPMVDLFGIGGPEVRWRHTAASAGGVRPGAYTAWATLVVPEGCAELAVDITARFDLITGSEEALLYEPTAEPANVVLKLSDSMPALERTLRPGLERPATHAPQTPRVFISYTHDDQAHLDAVLHFAEFLSTRCGLDVHVDRWDLDRRRNWYLWAIDQITAADFVLVIASADCKRVADGKLGGLANRGMQSELSVLMDQLHNDRDTWLGKILPVVLPGHSPAEIPLFLQPGIADFYIVSEYTVEGAEALLRVITRQPVHTRPQPNSEVVRLPTRPWT
ncbi:SEFIR domain-containing protein [Nocardia sp. NPDC020380]|uniref:SEFIR domain-containing protein n=1 Tax=Nocardia sp. NPDC020380 TaxID=3364309 RepID=UPI0037B9DF37